jgi:hypothetical protein
MPSEGEAMGKGLVEGLIDALSDKHAQLDLQLRGLTLNLGGSRLGLQASGTVTLAVHMRDLTDEERDAHVAHNIAAAKT